MSANTKISNLIGTQVPFYVRNDHENFVRFVEAYYEYMEQSGKTVDMAKSMPQHMDIDTTIDQFAEYFYNEYLRLIPRNIVADKNLILKHIKDFYAARGTEKSIEFLLRIMFNEQDTQFYYPKRDVLRASAGKWFIEKSLKITDLHTDGVANTDINAVRKFASRQITGNTSLATALVEKVEVYYEGGTLVNELKISQQTKDFESGETLFATYTDENITHTITANLFSGLLNTVTVTNPGSGYDVGDVVVLEGGGGTGGSIVITSVTSGNISGLSVASGGAGFQVNNSILISGGGGIDASANVLTVDTSGNVHPNSYNVMYTTILALANTPLNVANWAANSILVASGANANTTIANAAMYFTYANTGPVQSVLLINPGTSFSSQPDTSIVANTRILSLGILGRMEIVDGGINYATGEEIEFINVIGGYGSGARANVKTVDANGTITAVQFMPGPIAGYPLGGMGYAMNKLPTANVITANGSNANIIVTAILGDGEEIPAGTGEIGAILKLDIINRGSGYSTAPTLNLSSIGDGTAQAVATIITGTFEYPGRYLNDDGHLSSYNFLQDRDYYQDFSYVVKARQSVEKYRKALKDLIHPAGLKFFGEYLYVDDSNNDVSVATAESNISPTIFYSGAYHANGNSMTTFVNVSITSAATTNVANLTNVYVEFLDGDTGNLVNGIYSATYISPLMFRIALTRANVASITVANTGTGYSNGYIRFAGGSGHSANASYTVNTGNGGIETITFSNRGSAYLLGDKVFASAPTGKNANLVVTLQATTSANTLVSNVSGNVLFARA